MSLDQALLRSLLHDIATPLALARGAIDGALGHELDREALKEASDALGGLHRRLVAVSALHLGEGEPVATVSTCLADVRAMLGAGDEVHLAGDANVSMSPAALTIVLQNLVQNALRHGDGNVQVCIRPTPDGCVDVAVTNTVKTSTHGRFGIGLTIVEALLGEASATLQKTIGSEATYSFSVAAAPTNA